MWTQILVPHDFSRCAERAVEVAAAIARQSDGRLTLLHVSPIPPNLAPGARVTGPDGESVSIEDALTSGAERELAAVAARLEGRGIAVRTLARVTEPASPSVGILRLAEELGSDVIVLGTHGRTGLAHLLLGSVAEQVIRAATVPVVTVRASDDQAHPTREEAVAEDELAG